MQMMCWLQCRDFGVVTVTQHGQDGRDRDTAGWSSTLETANRKQHSHATTVITQAKVRRLLHSVGKRRQTKLPVYVFVVFLLFLGLVKQPVRRPRRLIFVGKM